MTTRAILQQQALGFSAREDLAGQIPIFITLAEARIARDIRVIAMIARDPAFAVTAGTAALPERFLGFRSVSLAELNGVTRRARLDYAPPDQFAEFTQDSENLSGITRDTFYTIEGLSIRVFPEEDVTLDVSWWQRFAPLVEQTDTNWLLVNHFDIYLAAVMKELNSYLMDVEQEAVWDAKFQTKVDQIHRSERRKQRSGPYIRRPAFAP